MRRVAEWGQRRVGNRLLRSGWMAAVLLLGAAVAPSCQSRCDEPGVTPDAAPDAGVDAGRDAGRPDARADAKPDAAPGSEWGFDPDAWVEGTPCDATVIQLPPSGNTGVARVSFDYPYVAYDDRREGNVLRSDIYLYDLETCREHQITRRDWTQVGPWIWERSVLFAHSSDDNSPMTQIAQFSLDTLEFQILSLPWPGSGPSSNGQQLVYYSWENSSNHGADLTLWDSETQQELRLAEAFQGAEAVSISPTHAAWVAWGGPDKDVYYVDLATQDVTHVESTWDPYTDHTAIWGDWLLWEDSRYEAKVNIMGLRLSTQEEVRLTDNGAYNGWPTLRRNLACWRTTYWGGTVGWDLVVYDLETGALRRVTQEPHPGYKCVGVDNGWLVYEKQPDSDYWENEIHAVDLVAAGLLDPTGQHVVP